MGNFIAGLSKKIHAPLGTIKAEAKAFEVGIIFAKKRESKTLYWKEIHWLLFKPSRNGHMPHPLFPH